ncbi:MAG: rRNA maturation RNase YbeY [Lachnospiraceae bacterium]|nr:rRNA maturation RNase YbeY [Lachnospiraceae bacterium]
MTSFVSIEADADFGFDLQAVADQVIEAVLDAEGCPYETSVNITLVDDPEIHRINLETREIDRATDVLSFPNLNFETPGDFSDAEEHSFDCFDPDSGELLLGDIIISVDHVRSQAKEYDHSLKREFAFLVAHSMFHLCGYDHMTTSEAAVMEEKQEAILQQLRITREN